MIAITENNLNDREDLFDDNDNQNGLTNSGRASDFGDEDDEYGVDRDEIEEDNIDDDGYDNTLTDDDLNYDIDDEESDVDEDKDFEAHLAPQSVDPDPNETPEEREASEESTSFPSTREYSRPQEGNDASYSEQTDVTPPNPHEFPSEGPAKADFSSRPHGRTTGRMLGHEPGTEGI
ncbi:hypothetical protein GCM10023149_51590 [Mucilaginibacter gynuensis]|uniref:Uncharacterized protein n=1 Tax=Mucilaginibacter gynuensis TaxID=1302236 RepID=A0ABP8HK53_9SPHI